ncbi:hypothetical protein Tco_0421909 [Tanacetum coccineum]
MGEYLFLNINDFNFKVEKVMRKRRSGLEVLGEVSMGFSRKGLFSFGDGVFLEEKGEEFGFDSKEDEVVSRVEVVSLVDRVFEGAFGGDVDDDFAMGEGLEEEALVEVMDEEEK